MGKADEIDVLQAIDSEFEYQQARWGSEGKNHEIASWINYMQSYLNEAQDLASRNSPETVALPTIRKVVAMGMKCMMEHGAPQRTLEEINEAKNSNR